MDNLIFRYAGVELTAMLLFKKDLMDGPTANDIHRSIHWLPQAGLVYLSTPKVACSTIKTSLWKWADSQVGTETFTGRPHRRGESPFNKGIGQLARNIDAVMASTFFAVARNPYSRILSAYLDKVGKKSPIRMSGQRSRTTSDLLLMTGRHSRNSYAAWRAATRQRSTIILLRRP